METHHPDEKPAFLYSEVRAALARQEELERALAKLEEVTRERDELREKVESQEATNKELKNTERKTLLTIIAALCEHERIDWQGRGASQNIMRMTDDLGAHVDDETIRKVLKKIPDALEARMK